MPARETEVKPMLKPDQVATELNVSERHVRRLCERGVLPALKLGRAWRIEPDFKDKLREEQAPE